MYCRYCGSLNDDNAETCRQCGASLSGDMNIQQRNTVQPYSDFVQSNVGQTVVEARNSARLTVDNLKTNRGLCKYILLSLITFNLYGTFVINNVSGDLNKTAGSHDHKKMMSYWWFFLLGIVSAIVTYVTLPGEEEISYTALLADLCWVALFIGMLVWFHKLCQRLGNELQYRHISYGFGASDFWLWGILGSLILIGPFVFWHKLFAASNKINEHHNCFGD